MEVTVSGVDSQPGSLGSRGSSGRGTGSSRLTSDRSSSLTGRESPSPALFPLMSSFSLQVGHQPPSRPRSLSPSFSLSLTLFVFHSISPFLSLSVSISFSPSLSVFLFLCLPVVLSSFFIYFFYLLFL